jgi:membrane-associated phospholipid phosphatase
LRTTAWMLSLVFLLAPLLATADESPSTEEATTVSVSPERSPQLRYVPWIEGPLTGLGAGLIVANGIFEGDIAPSTCSWCDRDSAGNDTLNGFDVELRSLRLDHEGECATSDCRLVRKWGDIAIWRLLPQLSLAFVWLAAELDGRPDDGPIDTLIVLETIVITALGTQLVRYTTARERPYVHFMPADERATRNLSADINSSFFSGHASVSFAMAVAAGTVASMRRSKWAPFIWVVGLALSSLAAYSRIAADLHYPSDVFIGAAFGSLVGFAVPYFLHPVERAPR